MLVMMAEQDLEGEEEGEGGEEHEGEDSEVDCLNTCIFGIL